MAKNSTLVSHLVNKCGCNQLSKAMGRKIMKLLHEFWDKEVAKCQICDGGCQLTMENGTTLLHEFAGEGHLAAVLFLFAECHCKPLQLTNDNGYTVLDCAIMAKNSTLVSFLVNKCGCNKLSKAMGKKIMKLLYVFWDEEVAKCLLCDGGCQLTMENGTTLLHKCARQGSLARVLFLVEKCKCDPNLQNENGDTILHVFCQSNMSSSIHKFCQPVKFDSSDNHHSLKQLIHNFKCNPNIKNKNGSTVLHTVCYSILQHGYSNDRCWLLYLFLYECKVSPHIHLNNTNTTLLHIVCKTILHGDHNHAILHYLIVECKCDPHIDKNIILRTLLQSVMIWSASASEILCYLLKESKIDPHLNLDNGELVCLMCYPLKIDHVKLSSFRQSRVKCHIYNSFHDSDVAPMTSYSESNETVMVLLCKNAESFYNQMALAKLLRYFIAFIECKCNSYKVLTKYKSALNQMYSYCLSEEGLIDPVCRTTIRRLIITLDYLTDTFITTLLKCKNENDEKSRSINEFLEEIQSHLITKEPFRVAKCILCSQDEYSPKMKSLLCSIVDECMLDPIAKDASGNAILHIACQQFHGNTTFIEYILSTGKADLLCCNKNDETPIMLLSARLDIRSRKKLQQLISRFGEVKVSHPIESYVNLVFLGNPGVGKSSLVKVINDRPSRLGYTFGRVTGFRDVTGVEPCTAGIIPHILNDRDLGRIIVHDLAGQAEYYSSHTAVLENLLQGSAAVFVLVVSLADKSIQETFQFWLTVIENVSHNALQQCHLFVVASYADLDTDNIIKLEFLRSILKQHFPSSSDIIACGYDEIFKLDCRKIGGSQLNLLVLSLSEACKSISSKTIKEMSLYCHMLYDFFQRDRKVVYRLESLLITVNEQTDLFLPTNIDSLFDIVNTLSSTGLIVFLINKASPEKSWIVTDKTLLLADLDGVLFAPIDFKQHKANIVSNTGVIKLSKLNSIFPNYDSDLLVQFLQYMKLCEVITIDFTKSLSTDKNKDVDSDQCIFVPALIRETKMPEIEEPLMFGWFLHCTNPHHFFLSRFLHLILLHLACKYSIHTHGANKFERDCKVWATGIYWMDTKGVQTLVELVDNNQSLVVLMRCQDGAINEMMKLVKSVIIEILTCKQQVLPKVDTCEYIINCSQLQFPLQSWEELTLYNMELLAKCYINNDKFIYDRKLAPGKQISISNLFPDEVTADQYYESIFADRDPKVCNTIIIINNNLIIIFFCFFTEQNLVASNFEISLDETTTTSATIPTSQGMMQSNSTVLRESNEKMQGNTPATRKSNEIVQSNSTVTRKSDELTSCHSLQNTAFIVLKEHTPLLLRLLSDPDKLSDELWAKELLSDAVRDRIETTLGISRYDKARMILTEVSRYIELPDSNDVFIQFCEALINHGQPGLKEIAEKMISS